MVNKKPIAVLYGGSFDPPHIAHQKIVERLVSLPYIDKVIITPAYLNPFKTASLASAKKRLEWSRKVFDHNKAVIDPGEVLAGRSVYTYDTLKRLGNEYDIRYIAIGSDNLTQIERWHEFDKLNEEYIWLVFERDGEDSGYEKLHEYKRFDLREPVSSSQIRSSRYIHNVSSKISEDVEKLLKDNNG